MAKRRFVRRGAAPTATKAPVRKQVEPEDVEELLDEDLDDVDEDEGEAPAPRRSRRVVETDDETADVEYNDDNDDDDDMEYEEEPAPVAKKKVVAPIKPVKRVATTSKVVTKKIVPPAPVKSVKKDVGKQIEPVATIKKIDQVMADNVFTQLLEGLQNGAAILVTRLGTNKWQLTKGEAVKPAKMGNSKAWHLMVSDEYRDWVDAWNEKTYEEKKAYAKKLKVKWDEHDNPQIDVMRITQAVRAKEGVEKYKPEFRTRAARAAFKGQ